MAEENGKLWREVSGAVLLLVGGVLGYFGLLGQWAVVGLCALGAGMIAPDTFTKLASAAKDILPWKK